MGTFDFEAEAYNWGDDEDRPHVAEKDLVIYEMPIRTFTADPSSGLDEGERGTFKGVTQKVSPHVRSAKSRVTVFRFHIWWSWE